VTEHTPYPENVPGDFYVEDGCCTMCEMPFAVAPDLFGEAQNSAGCEHCFVKRQPRTPAELGRMVDAIMCAELQCIRYRGSNRLLQLRLIEVGEGVICDGLPPDLQAEVGRDEADRQRRWQERQRSQAAGRRPPASRPWWRFW